MANKTLYQAREFGIKGEAFINKHLHEFITDNLLLNLEDTSGKNVEGMDSTSFSAKLGASAPEFIPDFADPGDQPAYPITAITYGGNEIKTINSFLWRTNDGEDPTGTLGFELWETDSKRHYGWAYKIFHPEKSMNAVQPAYLFFLLVAYGSAFACVAFEDIDKLHARLANVAHEDGFDIDEYPLGREMNIPSIVGNMWQVPLSRIEDLAVGTLIGNKPRIRPDIIAGTQKCSKRTQNQRYDHLVQLASGRSIDSDPQFVGIILADGADQTLQDTEYDFSLVDKEFWKDYPKMLEAIRRTKVFNILYGVLWNMLAHEFPIKLEKNSHYYYPIARDYLYRWLSDSFLPMSKATINGYLKILSYCGLLEQFIAFKGNKDPAILKLNRANANGKNIILYQGDHRHQVLLCGLAE